MYTVKEHKHLILPVTSQTAHNAHFM